MFAKTKLLVLAVLAIFFAACGGEPVEVKEAGKTAKEWKQSAEQCMAKLEFCPIQAFPRTLPDPKAEQAQIALQDEADKAFLAGVKGVADTISSDLITSVVTNAFVGLSGLMLSDELVLGNIAWVMSDGAQEAITSSKASSAPGDKDTGPSYTAVRDARIIIKSAIVTWVTADLSRMPAVWTAVRPLFRQQYALLKTLRGYEPFFKTRYSSTAFAQISECLEWQDNLAGPDSDKKIRPEETDLKRCGAAFKKFGIKATFGDAESGGYSARNALWIVKFLARRSADGGDKFAQQFQKLALDYIK